MGFMRLLRGGRAPSLSEKVFRNVTLTCAEHDIMVTGRGVSQEDWFNKKGIRENVGDLGTGVCSGMVLNWLDATVGNNSSDDFWFSSIKKGDDKSKFIERMLTICKTSRETQEYFDECHSNKKLLYFIHTVCNDFAKRIGKEKIENTRYGYKVFKKDIFPLSNTNCEEFSEYFTKNNATFCFLQITYDELLGHALGIYQDERKGITLLLDPNFGEFHIHFSRKGTGIDIALKALWQHFYLSEYGTTTPGWLLSVAF